MSNTKRCPPLEIYDEERQQDSSKLLPAIAEREESQTIINLFRANRRSVIFPQDVVVPKCGSAEEQASRIQNVWHWVVNSLPLYDRKNWSALQTVIIEKRLFNELLKQNAVEAEKAIVEFLRCVE